MRKRFARLLTLALAALFCLGSGVFAQDDMEQRMQNLEERQGILATEFERLRSLFVLPEDADYKSAYGLGPAASKIYGRERGLSLGGYGQTWLQVFDHKQDKWDYLRFVLYAGYKFTDNLLLNVEIEIEHADEIYLEFATIDYLYRPEMNFRFGMVLMPVGFVNEIHEPPYYYGNQRPVVEQTIIPTTWRENGAGFFGEFAGGAVQYRLYTTTNLSAGNTKDCCSGTAGGFDAKGVRSGRQKGSRTLADMAVVARVDATPMNGLLVGGSVVRGDTGQGLTYGDSKAAATMTMWEGHAQYQYRNLHLRALYVRNSIEDTQISLVLPKVKASARFTGVGTARSPMIFCLPLIPTPVWVWCRSCVTSASTRRRRCRHPLTLTRPRIGRWSPWASAFTCIPTSCSRLTTASSIRRAAIYRKRTT